MKQRFSSREQEEYDAAAAAAARGFSRLTKFMKVISSSSSRRSSTPPLHPYHLHDQHRQSMITNQEDFNMSSSSSSSSRRRTDHSTTTATELPNQEEVQQPQPQPQPQPTSIRMYTCKTCGRNFESFQALGGHRASHNMKPVGPGIVGEDGRYQNIQYKAKLHQCSICDKGYQTGQALGGHMRKHRELLENQRLAAAAAESNVNHQQQADNAALRWAQMNAAAAIFQYSNAARMYNAPHQPAPAGTGARPEAGEEILREKIQNRKGLNIDLNLDVSENEELGLRTDQ